jgi:hypothetical protein
LPESGSAAWATELAPVTEYAAAMQTKAIVAESSLKSLDTFNFFIC